MVKDYEVSICILTLNHLEITQKCLVSLMKTDFPANTEIIIVDNGSTDGTSDWLREFQDEYSTDDIRIMVLLNKENRGCTGGRNLACSMAVGKYIMILDNDVEIIHSDWLKKMIAFYETQDNVGIVGPKLMYPEEPHFIQTAGLGVTKAGKVGYWGQGLDRNTPEYNQVRDVQGYPAACWLFLRDLFVEIGEFDEAYHPVQFEDVDFCFRVREKGYRVIYYPEVEMYHHEHVTTKGTNGLSFIRVTLKNGLLFKERWKHMYENEEGMGLDDIQWLK